MWWYETGEGNVADDFGTAEQEDGNRQRNELPTASSQLPIRVLRTELNYQTPGEGNNRKCNRERSAPRRVAALFALADQLEARLAAAQLQVDTLTPSLLARAFRGALVPQNPNDEPASASLERVHRGRKAG